MNFETELADRLKGGSPARIRVRAKRLPMHEGDLAMTKLLQVGERQFCSQVMVEDDI